VSLSVLVEKEEEKKESKESAWEVEMEPLFACLVKGASCMFQNINF
jgi:hypothetical protein